MGPRTKCHSRKGIQITDAPPPPARIRPTRSNRKRNEEANRKGKQVMASKGSRKSGPVTYPSRGGVDFEGPRGHDAYDETESDDDETEEEEGESEYDDEENEEDEEMQDNEEEDDGEGTLYFQGGHFKLDLLKSYKTHACRQIWKHYLDPDETTCREVLKIYYHGRSLQAPGGFVSPGIQEVVRRAGLETLAYCNYPHVDAAMLTAFIERWHPETSSFHMPFGEMTITLDDVSSLLHIPVTGSFFTLEKLTPEGAVVALVRLLGVTEEEAYGEVQKNNGALARYSWLLGVANEKAANFPDQAARAFLLRLVGMTLFCDKTNNRVDVAYLQLFEDLSEVGTYAWGAAALAYLYDQLKDASRDSIKACSGYMTLLQTLLEDLRSMSLITVDPSSQGYVAGSQICETNHEMHRMIERAMFGAQAPGGSGGGGDEGDEAVAAQAQQKEKKRRKRKD